MSCTVSIELHQGEDLEQPFNVTKSDGSVHDLTTGFSRLEAAMRVSAKDDDPPVATWSTSDAAEWIVTDAAQGETTLFFVSLYTKTWEAKDYEMDFWLITDDPTPKRRHLLGAVKVRVKPAITRAP